jgi:hypothetical protein
LPGDVADAEDHRGDEATLDRAGAADRHHEQEVHHVLERERGIEAEHVDAEARRPGRRVPEPSAKVTPNTRLTSMPRPAAATALSTDARTCAPKRVFTSSIVSTVVMTMTTAIRNSR